jgi:hypothetical protein
MTLLGLSQLLLGAKPHSRSPEGVLQFVAGPRSPLGWYMRLLGIHAWTLGAVVLYRDRGYVADRRLYRHELEHVVQTMRLGPLMPFAYFGGSLWQLLRGRRPYVDNPLEVSARSAECRPIPRFLIGAQKGQ